MPLRDSLAYIVLGNPLRAWLIALAAFSAVLALLLGIRSIAVRRLRVLAERTATDLDDLAVDLLEHIHVLLFMAIGVGTAGAFLDLTEQDRLTGIVTTGIIIAVTTQAVIWGNRLIRFWTRRYIARRGIVDPGSIATINVLAVVARSIVALAILLAGLDNLGIEITTLVTTLGIGGIAIALAVQNILGDLLAALSIVLDKPFVVGDSIVVDEFRGEVQHIGLKTTRIRSVGGEQIIFSNTDLLKSRIRNFRRLVERRTTFTIRLAFGVPPATLARVPGIIRETVEAQHPTRFERSHFVRYSDTAFEFETVYVVLAPSYGSYMDIQQAINLRLLERFAAEQIELACPPRPAPPAPR